MLIFSADPGITGGLAVLASDGSTLRTYPMPVIRDKKSRWVDAAQVMALVSAFSGPRVFVVERVASRPEEGVASVFRFGAMFGGIMAAFSVFQLPIVLCTPGQWKLALGLIKCDKSRSIALARQLYAGVYLPNDDYEGQAEALLIAHWYRTCRLKEAA
jgi:crossover junction endodeoxyribonuclease RuvC